MANLGSISNSVSPFDPPSPDLGDEIPAALYGGVLETVPEKAGLGVAVTSEDGIVVRANHQFF